MFTPHHVPYVVCHVSHVSCHVSGVTCQVRCHVSKYFFFNYYFVIDWARRWRVYYQWGLPRLICLVTHKYLEKITIYNQSFLAALASSRSLVVCRLVGRSGGLWKSYLWSYLPTYLDSYLHVSSDSSDHSDRSDSSESRDISDISDNIIYKVCVKKNIRDKLNM